MTTPHNAVDQLTGLVRDGDRVLVATGAGEPSVLVPYLLEAADRAGATLEIVQVMTGSRGGILAARSDGHRLRVPVPGHGGPVEPEEVLPSSMRQLAQAIATGDLRIDGLMFGATSPEAETLAPALCVDLVPIAFPRSRYRAVECNAAMPHVLTDEVFVRSECDVVIDSDVAPPTLDLSEADDVTRQIGANVASLVRDGDVLELGIGGSLAGVADALNDRGVSVSVHTGLMSDWTRTLVEAGTADRPPACDDHPVVASVAMGSPEFYSWLDHSSAVRLVGSLHAHDPAHLMGLGRFVAVNAASRVDLHGQVGVGAEIADRRVVGGLLDFSVAGAYAGASVIAMRSVDREGRTRILPGVGAVQLPAGLVSHVVTEHGVAVLAGRTWQERRTAIIEVAAPEHRETLRRTA